MLKTADQYLDDRSADRRPVDLNAVMQTPGEAVSAALLDISEGGFSARLDQALEIGTEVQLSLPSLGSKSARVAWRSGQEHGFQFDLPIAEHAVAAADRSSAVLWVDFTAKRQIPAPFAEPVVEKFSQKRRLAILIVGIVGSWAIAAVAVGIVVRTL